MRTKSKGIFPMLKKKIVTKKRATNIIWYIRKNATSKTCRSSHKSIVSLLPSSKAKNTSLFFSFVFRSNEVTALGTIVILINQLEQRIPDWPQQEKMKSHRRNQSGMDSCFYDNFLQPVFPSFSLFHLFERFLPQTSSFRSVSLSSKRYDWFI